jgi:hypothetical protein
MLVCVCMCVYVCVCVYTERERLRDYTTLWAGKSRMCQEGQQAEDQRTVDAAARIYEQYRIKIYFPLPQDTLVFFFKARN